MHPLSAYDLICVSSAAVLILALYAPSLSPTIAGGDSGELVAEGCALGTAHPPGYPLFTMMVYILKLIAGRLSLETAYAVNISSAILTTLAAYFMGLIIIRVQLFRDFDSHGLRLGGAILGMFAFAFSPLIWQYAVTAEVFPLNTFFAALLVYLVVEYTLTKKSFLIYIGAVVSGLALSNQHTIILFEFPLIMWVFYVNRDEILRRPMVLFYYGFAGLAGLSCYAYLPIASRLVDSPGGWGDVQSVSGFLHHFLRKDYGTFQLYSGANGSQTEGMVERTIAYLTDLYREQGLYVSPALAAIGIFAWTYSSSCEGHPKDGSIDASTLVNELALQTSSAVGKKQGSKTLNRAAHSASSGRKLTKSVTSPVCISDAMQMLPLVLVITQVFYFAVFHSLSNLPLSNILLYGVHQRFWMQPNVITFIWVGIGFNGLLSGIATIAVRFNASIKSIHSLSLVLSILSIALAIALSAWQYRKNHWMSDQHENFHFQEYAKAILDPLPNGAVLFINYDMQWTAVRYMQKCLGFRADVIAINLSMMSFAWFGKKHHLYPNISFPGTHYSRVKTSEGQRPFTMYNFLEANPHHNVFLTGKLSFVESLIDSQYAIIPYGLTTQFVRNDSKNKLSSAAPFQQSNTRNWQVVSNHLLSLPSQSKYTEVTWEWTIGRDVTDKVADIAAHLLETAIKNGGSPSDAYWSLIDAAYWFENAIALESLFIESDMKVDAESNVSLGQVYGLAINGTGVAGSKSRFPATLLKNAGLVHIHLVQSKAPEASKDIATPPSHGLFRSILGFEVEWPEGDTRWKLWSTNRFLRFWGLFLSHPDARNDSQFEMIRNLYQKASGKAFEPESGGIRNN